MSETKWTPGPWTYAPIPGYQYVVEIEKSSQIFLCAGAVPPGREEEIRANAQLAAAAEDLYAALSFADIVLEFALSKESNWPPKLVEAYRQSHMKARAALARARGETA
jgi:hypothetical protein